MIAVTQEREQIYTIQINGTDLLRVKELSKSLGMNRSTLLAASLGKGIEQYYGMIREIENHDKQVCHDPNKPINDNTS